MTSRLLLLIVLFLFPTIPAQAEGRHIMGTVVVIDAQHIEVKTSKGTLVSVKLTKHVRFRDKDNPRSDEPPAVGDRVIIEATKEKKVLTATVVHYSAAKNVPVATEQP